MLVRCAMGLAAVGAFAGSALSAPLGLTLNNKPDFFSSFIDVTYDAAPGSLTLRTDGFAIGFDEDGSDATPSKTVVNGVFTIVMQVNNAGVASGGTVSITGSIPSLGIAQSTLLSGELKTFGFSNTGTFEFVWKNLSGSTSNLFLAIFPEAGTILTNTGFPGSFANSFNNTGGNPGFGTAVSNTSSLIPGPGGLAVLLTGAFVASRRRR